MAILRQSFFVKNIVGGVSAFGGDITFNTDTLHWAVSWVNYSKYDEYPAYSQKIVDRSIGSPYNQLRGTAYRIPTSYDSSGTKRFLDSAAKWNAFLDGDQNQIVNKSYWSYGNMIVGIYDSMRSIEISTSDEFISAFPSLPYDSGDQSQDISELFTFTSSNSLCLDVEIKEGETVLFTGRSPFTQLITASGGGTHKVLTVNSKASHSLVTVQGMFSSVKAIGLQLPYSNTAEGSQNISATLYSDDSSLFDVFVNNVKVSDEGGVVGYGLEETVAVGETMQVEIRRASADETVQRDYANRWDIRFLSALGKWQQLKLPVDAFEEGVPTQYPGSGSIQLPMALNQPITDQWVQVSFSGMDQKAVQPGTYQLQVLASDSTSWVPFANFDFDGALITKVKHFGGVAAGLILAGLTTQEYREIRIWAIAATLPDDPPEPVAGETPLPRPDPLPSEPETPTPVEPEGPVTPTTEPIEPDPEGTPVEPTAPTPTGTTIPTPNTETCVCSPWYAAIAQAVVNSGAYISQAVSTIVSPLIQGVASVEKLRYELVASIGKFLHQVEGIKLSLEALRTDLCKGVNAISPEVEKVEARLEAIQNDLYIRLGEIKEDIHSIDSRLYLMDGDVEMSITDELGNISTSIENPAGLIQQEISCGVDASGVLNVTTKSINEMES